MSSIITFAANNDLFRKRKRVYRACENCKKRRKRCTHTFDDDASDSVISEGMQNPDESTVMQSTQITPPVDDARTVDVPHEEHLDTASRSRSGSPSQFFGRSRPETLFLDQTSGAPTVNHDCGYWMPTTPQKSPSRSNQALSDEDRALQQYLAVVNVDLLPPQQHLDALIKLYFEYVHPFLPIVDPNRPGRRKSGKLLSPMLLQSICIIASRHEQARPHLVLQPGGPVLAPREFAKRLYKSVNAALNAKLERDRLLLIQVLALLSLYSEGTEGAEVASMHLSEAIHHAHTLGMQFGRAVSDCRAEYFNDSYWCLWMLDRLNSTMNGRPVFISDDDSRIESPLAQEGTKHTPFGIALQITSALNHIISYYRPHRSECTGWERDFPGFEEMIGDKGDKIAPPILAFLELYYHSAAIMSHRAQAINKPVISTPSFVRQSLSTVRVLQIMRDECQSNHPPLPIVPWAVSLAMAHAYRVFRQSKLAALRSRARNDLQTFCDMLEKMRVEWWSAGTMADLGRAALKKASSRRDIGANKKTNGSLEKSADHVVDHEPNDEHGSRVRTEPVVRVVEPETAEGAPQQTTGEGSQTLMDPALEVPLGLDPSISPDWLNFDTAFENFEGVLGSFGPDMSMELLRPFNFEELENYGLGQ